MRQTSTKFSQNLKFEFKKSYILYIQNSLKVWTKVGLNFIHYEQMKVSEMIEGFIYAQQNFKV